MGLGCTARGCSFVYQAGIAVDGVGGTCGSRGGMVSWPRGWHTPCGAWYWCQATRSVRSACSARGMRSHSDCGMQRQDTWCRSAADALFHHSVTVSCHGLQALDHMLQNATFQRMQCMRRLWTVVPWWRGQRGHLGEGNVIGAFAIDEVGPPGGSWRKCYMKWGASTQWGAR